MVHSLTLVNFVSVEQLEMVLLQGWETRLSLREKNSYENHAKQMHVVAKRYRNSYNRNLHLNICLHHVPRCRLRCRPYACPAPSNWVQLSAMAKGQTLVTHSIQYACLHKYA